MSRKTSRNKSRNKSRIKRLRRLAGLLAAVLSLGALAAAQSELYPTYFTGPQPNGSWVVSDGQIITPAGTQVNLGIQVRAKAIALNPNVGSHTAAVLLMGASQAVEVFDTMTGDVLQNYITFGHDPTGSYSGIAYSADGKRLVFSQDSSNVTIAKVSAEGLLEDDAQVSVPPNNSFITCFPNSPPGDGVPCGTLWSTGTSYPGGLALSKDGKSAYALLNQNNTLAKIDLTAKPPMQGEQIRVGNAPHSIVIDSNGTTAYVSNEGGRAARKRDFQIYSAGTEIVADPVVGAAITGTVSAVDLASMKVTATISTGLHPTGMALYGPSPVGRQYLQRHHLGYRHGHQQGGADDQPWAADRSARRRPTGLWRRAELDRRRCQERRCLRRALQCQRDRGDQPQRRREESCHGRDPGSLCAELGRAGRGR